MKKIITLLTLALVATGCKYSINGVLNVSDKLKLDDTTYRAGTYNSSVSIKKTTFSKRYKVTLDVDGNKHTYKARKGVSIPANGDFRLSARQLNAPYGMRGNSTTNVTDEDRTRRGTESCSYSEPYTVCNTDHMGRVNCHTQYRIVTGSRNVEYFNRTKEQDLTLRLMDGEKEVADFSGENTSTYRVYTYEGICRR